MQTICAQSQADTDGSVFCFFLPLQSVPEFKWSLQPVCARAEVFGAALKMTVITYDFAQVAALFYRAHIVVPTGTGRRAGVCLFFFLLLLVFCGTFSLMFDMCSNLLLRAN